MITQKMNDINSSLTDVAINVESIRSQKLFNNVCCDYHIKSDIQPKNTKLFIHKW